MTPEREEPGRGPRQDKADPALRFEAKGKEEVKAGGRAPVPHAPASFFKSSGRVVSRS